MGIEPADTTGALMTEEKLLKHEDSTPQSDEDALHVEEEDEDHDVEATEHDEEAAEREEEEEEKAVGTPIAANDAIEEAEEADAVKEAEEAGAVAAEVKEEDAERTTEKVRWPILQRNVLLSS